MPSIVPKFDFSLEPQQNPLDKVFFAPCPIVSIVSTFFGPCPIVSTFSVHFFAPCPIVSTFLLLVHLKNVDNLAGLIYYENKNPKTGDKFFA